MKSMPFAIALALAIAAPALVRAEGPPNPLQPLAFLAGHCFKGEFPGGKDVDEHCFEWLYGGKALRDVHVVRGAGHPDYRGESTYYWDSAAKRIEYLYIENAGGVMRGAVEPGDGAVVFPATSFVSGGQTLKVRVRWTLHPDGSYEAWSEREDKDDWKTMFRVNMVKSS